MHHPPGGLTIKLMKRNVCQGEPNKWANRSAKIPFRARGVTKIGGGFFLLSLSLLSLLLSCSSAVCSRVKCIYLAPRREAPRIDLVLDTEASAGVTN